MLRCKYSLLLTNDGGLLSQDNGRRRYRSWIIDSKDHVYLLFDLLHRWIYDWCCFGWSNLWQVGSYSMLMVEVNMCYAYSWWVHFPKWISQISLGHLHFMLWLGNMGWHTSNLDKHRSRLWIRNSRCFLRNLKVYSSFNVIRNFSIDCPYLELWSLQILLLSLYHLLLLLSNGHVSIWVQKRRWTRLTKESRYWSIFRCWKISRKKRKEQKEECHQIIRCDGRPRIRIF